MVITFEFEVFLLRFLFLPAKIIHLSNNTYLILSSQEILRKLLSIAANSLLKNSGAC